jgi:hypothetical protein
MMSFMSKKAMNLGGGEHHTNRTGGDDKQRVLANALAEGLTGTEFVECRLPMVGNTTLGRQPHVTLGREDEAIL